MNNKRAHMIVVSVVLVMFSLSACGSANPFPLSEPGQYDFGTKGGFSPTYSLIDTSRDNREIGLMVWYPAKLPANAAPSDYNIDAEPDLSGAPYPLILSSAKVGSIFGPHLASRGFVVVGVKGLDSYAPWNENLFNQPLDILFALDQVASKPLDGLEGMIDAEHAGVMGYSFDGYNALAMSGARVDPEFYLSQCANVSDIQPALSESDIRIYCDPANHWGEFSDHAGTALTASSDGLWQAMTDERIRAVMPMAPEGRMLFGEHGLSSVDRPTLIIAATEDIGCDYKREAVYIFDHIRTPDKIMISFVGQDHYMIFQDDQASTMKHFAAAFLGYYLQGHEDYVKYFSEDFVSKRDGLAWGVYKGE